MFRTTNKLGTKLGMMGKTESADTQGSTSMANITRQLQK
jgi:hypothetical protein